LDDNALLEINSRHLQHDTFTDIITFDYSETDSKGKVKVVGEIYISVDRVKDNALKFKERDQVELLRVILHGLLHLCGYKDKNPKEQALMRAKEDFYLEKWNLDLKNDFQSIFSLGILA
jgi:rRNA maturation RNase YbeY